NVSGLIFMGGAGSVNEPKDWITQELALIRQADTQSIPMLGICFGAQLISKALGGDVCEGSELEIGWHNVQSVNEVEGGPPGISTEKKAWLSGLPENFIAFQWHAHTLTVPPGAIQLWRSDCYEQQGFAKGQVLGMQFHLEVSAESILDLSHRYASDLSHVTHCSQSVEQINENIQQRVDKLHDVADQIYHRWLSLAGIISADIDDTERASE
ncbi:MAG: gamma-glutamyl-gamma-aminobutyrate hydrolase family protein, partial [Gammaproteobacteria bacterium]|nr:gamma-glutamyl-gamma-aminobutyrate hydrolase family protein [Gammaproteobacteria bacterium]